VEAIAARDEVAGELAFPPVLLEDQLRSVTLDIRKTQRRCLETDIPAAREPQGDQILDHLGLTIGRDPAPAGELVEGDAMALALHRDLDAMVAEAFAIEPGMSSGLAQQLHRRGFQYAGTDAPLDMLPAAGLEDDGVDALEMEQLGEQQARRTGPDDCDLGAHSPPWKT